jgi:protein TonB
VLPYQVPSPQQRAPLSRRATGLALALAINVLLLLVLLSLGVGRKPPPNGSPSLVVDLIPEAHNAAPPAPSTARPTPPAAQADTQPAPKLKPPPIVLPAKPTITPPAQSDLLELDKSDMAASDIAHLPSGGDGSPGDSEEVGKGPNGQVLYAAEWARRPTNAELGGYLPRDAPDGYGLVACKTISDDRVEDCIELEQQPLGSHLASAVRQAAWQFRVRPPHKNGKELVGSWVQIRIDYESVGRPERSY